MNKSERIEGIEHAFTTGYITSYQQLQDAVYEAWPDATFSDIETIMVGLAANLIQNNRPLVCKAISEGLYKAPEDCSRDWQDYSQDFIIHLLEHREKLPGLLFPTNAKSSTVLYSLVKSRMRGVRKQLIDRERLVKKRLGDIRLSGIEIAKPELDEQNIMMAA